LRRLKKSSFHFDQFRWSIRYLFFPRNDRWYGSLFQVNPDLLVGEVTPAYAILDADTVSHMATLMPRAKIIYILRNPVDRSWSAAAMRLENKHGTHIDQASDTQIFSVLSKKQTVKRADYLKHIDLWKQYFGEDNIFIGFYDDLSMNPVAFLCRVLTYIGVESSERLLPPNVRNPVGARCYKAIPERFMRHLVDLHMDQIRTIHRRFPNEHTRRWLEMALTHT
jgi:Sulfotransferase domain